MSENTEPEQRNWEYFVTPCCSTTRPRSSTTGAPRGGSWCRSSRAPPGATSHT
ncbi:hypothetical protein [Leucobacter soli]|uniref:hypothetical protein n=1 Tax=Leucobacter soli TaxID=2812850 RepID=UPI003622AAA6